MFGLNPVELDDLYLKSYSELEQYLNFDSKVRKLKISY